ncbi:hypothetical protein Lser_V15G03611 [Lactuca serriola]
MAEIVVSAVITVLCEKLISGDLMKLARTEGIDSKLKKWKKNLPLIQAVLADATQKQIKERAVQLWVNDLQELAYDIDDVLDDLATEALRRKLNQEAEASSSSSKVLKLVPNCCTNFTPRNIMYGQQMSSKLEEITIKLHDLVDQKNDLGLNVTDERSTPERRLEENSLVDESKIMGREGDKVTLLGKLLGCDENVSVVSIVGMGGIGKTTLAKVLYNEEKVKDHFELRAWVCVSEELDVFNISKAIFQAVTGKNKDFANLDLLHVALKEELSKKRFLLVLDDVWNEDHKKWELLQSPLLVGAPGSRIIVTTRSSSVASVMDSQETYPLDVLSNEDALSLFAQHALGEKSFDKHPTFKLLGEGMVQKCGRLPLALKALGRILKGNRNVNEWEELLKSEIWDIEDGSDILPALRLSYYHLPPHLKQLFAYCSLIPKDYVFDKNKLVLLWMAEGFLSQSKGNKSMELLGHEYFEELKSRSFFQHSTDDELGYTMHDLINDLATNVAGEFSFRMDGDVDVSDTNETFEKVRHFSFVVQGSGSYRKLNKLQRAKCLRTFLIMRSLLVHDCYELSSLPKSFARLINLRHLDISNTPKLNKMPLGIGGLTSLQTLPMVFIEEGNGFKISNLKDLSDLQGQLSIMGLEKVINPMQAKDANLYQKKGLDVLEMGWGNEFDSSGNDLIEYEVFKELRPHPNLKKLSILNKKGTRFPTWVGDPSFDQLTEITLYGCRSTHLPTLGILWSLRRLIVERMMQEHPSTITELIVGDFGFLPVSRLRSLEINDCKNLKSFPYEHFQSLTSLERLEIRICPSMDYSFPCGVWPPNLRKLGIGGLNKPMSEWGPQNFPTSLVELKLYGNGSGVVSFAVAEDGRNTTTPTSSSSSSFLLPPSLVSLRLFGFTDVESFSEVLPHLPCLKRLHIISCPKITDLKTTSGPSNLAIEVW